MNPMSQQPTTQVTSGLSQFLQRAAVQSPVSQQVAAHQAGQIQHGVYPNQGPAIPPAVGYTPTPGPNPTFPVDPRQVNPQAPMPQHGQPGQVPYDPQAAAPTPQPQQTPYATPPAYGQNPQAPQAPAAPQPAQDPAQADLARQQELSRKQAEVAGKHDNYLTTARANLERADRGETIEKMVAAGEDEKVAAQKFAAHNARIEAAAQADANTRTRIEREELMALSTYPMFDKGSSQYNAELAKIVDKLYTEVKGAQTHDKTKEVILGQTASPLAVFKHAADLIQAAQKINVAQQAAAQNAEAQAAHAMSTPATGQQFPQATPQEMQAQQGMSDFRAGLHHAHLQEQGIPALPPGYARQATAYNPNQPYGYPGQ